MPHMNSVVSKSPIFISDFYFHYYLTVVDVKRRNRNTLCHYHPAVTLRGSSLHMPSRRPLMATMAPHAPGSGGRSLLPPAAAAV